jgi:hypothetical protein
MAALSGSRNTPEWPGFSNRYHYGLIPVEASTSIYVGSMVAINNNGRAVPAQSRASGSTLSKLNVIGICEYIYAGGVLPPGIDALNQTGNAPLYPGATATLGTAGAISVGVVAGCFGMDVDNTVTTANLGEMCVAVDDHTVGMGTLVANTTSITVPSAAPLINVLKPDIIQGSFDAYSATGAGGTHYLEGTDFAVDYQSGLFMALSGGAISVGGTVFVTYRSAVAKVMAGEIVAIDGGLAYVNFLRDNQIL